MKLRALVAAEAFCTACGSNALNVMHRDALKNRSMCAKWYLLTKLVDSAVEKGILVQSSNEWCEALHCGLSDLIGASIMPCFCLLRAF